MDGDRALLARGGLAMVRSRLLPAITGVRLAGANIMFVNCEGSVSVMRTVETNWPVLLMISRVEVSG
ncbi:hypothetical protein [Candidatus Amarolinea aalborgensis]|uniref:hypothetical protein n=1 Tax=Candidatus Amarolinea aalborgensis TaxID=2249329 RepID=UPI003BFA3859